MSAVLPLAWVGYLLFCGKLPVNCLSLAAGLGSNGRWGKSGPLQQQVRQKPGNHGSVAFRLNTKCSAHVEKIVLAHIEDVKTLEDSLILLLESLHRYTPTYHTDVLLGNVQNQVRGTCIAQYHIRSDLTRIQGLSIQGTQAHPYTWNQPGRLQKAPVILCISLPS